MTKQKNPDALENLGQAQVPAYALPYLINGDASGLTATDKAFIDEWVDGIVEEFGDVVYDVAEGDPYFTHFPEFGLPCDCLDVNIWGRPDKGEK